MMRSCIWFISSRIDEILRIATDSAISYSIVWSVKLNGILSSSGAFLARKKRTPFLHRQMAMRVELLMPHIGMTQIKFDMLSPVAACPVIEQKLWRLGIDLWRSDHCNGHPRSRTALIDLDRPLGDA